MPAMCMLPDCWAQKFELVGARRARVVDPTSQTTSLDSLYYRKTEGPMIGIFVVAIWYGVTIAMSYYMVFGEEV
jgi:hypothetical protein